MITKTKRGNYQGKFNPVNPQKYKGDSSNIVFRSSWELKLMNALDNNPGVVMWASEEISIPYISPVDNKIHRYFPDFLIGFKKGDGELHRMVVEVKPAVQTEAPKPRKKMTQGAINEMKTWTVNQAKWEAARRYCDEIGWKFVLATEKELEISIK